MSPSAHRPFLVSFMSIFIMVSGALQVGAGIVILVDRNDERILDALDASSSDVSTMSWVMIGFGALAFLVGLSLWSGRRWARTLVGVLALLNVAALVWGALSYHQVHWYNVIWPAVLYSLIAGYLFMDEDAKRFFA